MCCVIMYNVCYYKSIAVLFHGKICGRNEFIELLTCLDGVDAFTTGPIPEYEIHAPALDRHRQLMGIGSFFEVTAASSSGILNWFEL